LERLRRILDLIELQSHTIPVRVGVHAGQRIDVEHDHDQQRGVQENDPEIVEPVSSGLSR